jgi:hypothetical protein
MIRQGYGWRIMKLLLARRGRLDPGPPGDQSRTAHSMARRRGAAPGRSVISDLWRNRPRCKPTAIMKARGGSASLVSRRCGEHAEWMVAGPGSREARREMIRQRLGTVRARIQELRALRADGAGQVAPGEQPAARQRVAASRAAAERAAAACAQAFRFSAEAHERAALQHERAVAAGCGRAGEHGRLAADHRSAAAEDLRQAERVQAQLGGERAGDGGGRDADPSLQPARLAAR